MVLARLACRRPSLHRARAMLRAGYAGQRATLHAVNPSPVSTPPFVPAASAATQGHPPRSVIPTRAKVTAPKTQSAISHNFLIPAPASTCAIFGRQHLRLCALKRLTGPCLTEGHANFSTPSRTHSSPQRGACRRHARAGDRPWRTESSRWTGRSTRRPGK